MNWYLDQLFMWGLASTQCLTIPLQTRTLDYSLGLRRCESLILAQGRGLNQVTALARALNQETVYTGDRLREKNRERGNCARSPDCSLGVRRWSSLYAVRLNPGCSIRKGTKQQFDNFSKNGIPLRDASLHSSLPPPQQDMEREQYLSGSALHFVGRRLEDELGPAIADHQHSGDVCCPTHGNGKSL